MVKGQHPDRQAASHGHDPKAVAVRESMSREVAFCYEDQSSEEAERLMLEKHLRHLPVVDRDLRVIGMVTLEDLTNLKRKQIGQLMSEIARQDESVSKP